MKYFQIILLAYIITLPSCCKNKNQHTVNFFVNKSNPIYDLPSIDNNLKNNITLLNKLSRNLELVHKFKFGSIIDLQSNDNEVLLNELSNNDYSKTVNIYISGKDWAIDNAFYNDESNYIRVPFADRFDVRIILHEVVHMLAKDIDHVGYNNKVDGCVLTHENHCLNLMTTYDLSPFNFLITESQKSWINEGVKKMDCTNDHIYPNDLIANNIEQTIDCCPKPDLSRREDVESRLGKTVTEEHHKKLQQMAEELDKMNVCPLTLDSTKIFPTLRALETYQRDSLLNTVASLDTTFDYQVNYGIFPIGYNSQKILDIHMLYIEEYMNQINVQLKLESEFITQNTGLDPGFYATHSFKKIKNYLMARNTGVQIKVSEISQNFN